MKPKAFSLATPNACFWVFFLGTGAGKENEGGVPVVAPPEDEDGGVPAAFPDADKEVYPLHWKNRGS